MKIRFSAQGIRLRLTEQGIQELIQTGQLEILLNCANKLCGYILKINKENLVDQKELKLNWQESILEILISSQVFQHFLSVGKDGVITSENIKIERDFRDYYT